MRGRPGLLILAALSFTFSAWGDSVTLKNGRVYEGTFITSTGLRITLQVDKHTKRRFNVDDVQLVTFDRPPAQGGRSRVALSPIDQKYQQLSRSQDVLGYATSQEQDAPDGRGRFRLYQHGVIYYTSRSDAHVVTGPIRDQWASLGYERSELGYPTSDEIAAPDGGRMQYFEHGIVIWNSQDGAVVEISTR